MSTKRKQVSTNSLNSIYAITTHHDNTLDAAEAWWACHVCAIGWEPGRNAQADLFFDQIQEGDLILAYSCHNRIAYVGEIANGKYKEDHKNIVGKKGGGGFEYPYQYDVNWWERPHHFSRKEKSLPRDLRNQLAKRGKTVVQIKVNGKTALNAAEFSEVKEKIRSVRKEWADRREAG